MYKPKDLQTIVYFAPNFYTINSTEYAYRKYKVLYGVWLNNIFLKEQSPKHFYNSWLEIIHSRNLTGLEPKNFYLDTLNNL